MNHLLSTALDTLLWLILIRLFDAFGLAGVYPISTIRAAKKRPIIVLPSIISPDLIISRAHSPANMDELHEFVGLELGLSWAQPGGDK